MEGFPNGRGNAKVGYEIVKAKLSALNMRRGVPIMNFTGRINSDEKIEVEFDDLQADMAEALEESSPQ